MQLTPQQEDVCRTFPAHSLAKELEEVDIGNRKWEEVCFLQFLSVGRSLARVIISVASDIPLFAGAGARIPRVAAKRPAEDDAPVPSFGNKVDVAVWLLPNNRIALSHSGSLLMSGPVIEPLFVSPLIKTSCMETGRLYQYKCGTRLQLNLAIVAAT